MASYLTSPIMLEAETQPKKKKNAKGRKNWLKGEHVHQNSEPTTLFELSQKKKLLYLNWAVPIAIHIQDC